MNDNVVAITGLGVISPIGNNIESFQQNLFNNQSGAGEILRFPTEALPTKIACEVKNVKTSFRDVKIDFALMAAEQAMKMSGVSGQEYRGQLSIGLGLEIFHLEDLIDIKLNKNLHGDNELLRLNTPSDVCCYLISNKHQLSLPPLVHISACAAGTDAIGDAYLQIKNGDADFVLAGGTDSMINPMGIAGFSRIGAMTTKNDTPMQASMPFNKNRDGFVIGEGAGFLVLENYTTAKKRNANILGFISGYGNSLDAYSISDPHPEGMGAAIAMKRALNDANLSPVSIDAISAHATGTPKNDPAETLAIKQVFKDHNPFIFATKSQIGHCISAAGAIESVATVLSLQQNKLHKTLNLTQEDLDPQCNLNHVIGKNTNIKLNHIMKNSFGFGGQNACIIISKEMKS